MTLRRRFFEVLGSFALLILGVFVALFILEIFLRITERRGRGFPCSKFKGYFVKDEVIGHDHERNFPPTSVHFELGYVLKFWTNEFGCFDEGFDGQRDWILAVGDSFSDCPVNLEDSYTRRVEELFGGRFKVLRCGVAGYGTKAELLKAKKIIGEVLRGRETSKISKVRKFPKAIILQYYVGNDIIDDWLFPRYTVHKGYLTSQVKVFANPFTFQRVGLEEIERRYQVFIRQGCADDTKQQGLFERFKCFLNEKSYLYRKIKEPLRSFVFKVPFLRDTLGRHIRRPEEAVFPWDELLVFLTQNWFEVHAQNLLRFREFADEVGAKLVVLVVPTKAQVFYPETEQAKMHFFLLEKLIAFLDENGFNYINLLDVFRQKRHLHRDKPESLIYWKYDGHWGPLGNRIAGEVLYEKLREILE